MSDLVSLNLGELTAAVDPMGAQLCSLKLNENEAFVARRPNFLVASCAYSVSYSRFAS